jgi:hypothetical protein
MIRARGSRRRSRARGRLDSRARDTRPRLLETHRRPRRRIRGFRDRARSSQPHTPGRALGPGQLRATPGLAARAARRSSPGRRAPHCGCRRHARRRVGADRRARDRGRCVPSCPGSSIRSDDVIQNRCGGRASRREARHRASARPLRMNRSLRDECHSADPVQIVRLPVQHRCVGCPDSSAEPAVA